MTDTRPLDGGAPRADEAEAVRLQVLLDQYWEHVGPAYQQLKTLRPKLRQAGAGARTSHSSPRAIGKLTIQRAVSELLSSGLTQSQLAGMVPCSQSLISALLNGSRGARVSYVIASSIISLHAGRCAAQSDARGAAGHHTVGSGLGSEEDAR